MNIIIPLGGLGSRFQNEGYSRPKPFVRVLGKEMIRWVVDNLKLGEEDALVIVFNPSFMSMDVLCGSLSRTTTGTARLSSSKARHAERPRRCC